MSIYDRIPEMNLDKMQFNIPELNRKVDLPNLGIINVPVVGGALEPSVFNFQAPPQVSQPTITVEQEPEPEPTTALVMPSAPGSEGTGIASVGPRGTEIVGRVDPPVYGTSETPFQEQAIAPETTLMNTAQSGLGGFFTPAQVDQIVNPLPIPINTNNSSDMNRLLRQQRDTYRSFLSQPSDEQTSTQTPVYDSTNYQNIAGSGIMGTAYNPGTSFDFDAGFGFSPFFPRPRDEVDPYANIYRLYDPLRFSSQRVYDLGPVFDDSYSGFTGLTSLVNNDLMKIAANEQEARRPPMMF